MARERERGWHGQDLGCSVRRRIFSVSLRASDTGFSHRTASPQRNYAHFSPVNDVALHSNQGELISCDQNGAIKIWDLAGDCCSHELVRSCSLPLL